MPYLHKTFTSTEPVQITGVNANFTTAAFWAFSGFHPNGTPLNNVSTIYIGKESGRMPISVTSGSYFNWELTPKSQGEDLSNFWVKGAANDGVYVIYYP